MVLYTGTERWDLPKSLIIIHGTRRDLGGTLRERGRTRRATSDELSVYRRAMLPILAAVAELHRQWKTPLQDEEIRHILNARWTGATSGLDDHGELVIAEYRRAAHNGLMNQSTETKRDDSPVPVTSLPGPDYGGLARHRADVVRALDEADRAATTSQT
jgi:hypothetical protein